MVSYYLRYDILQTLMYVFLKFICISIITFFLTGCALIPKSASQPKKNWLEHQKILSYLNNWHIKGRMCVFNGKDVISVSFEWTQRGSQYYLNLHGPFNINNVQINGTPGQVSIPCSGETRISTYVPEELIQMQFGCVIPISEMIYWVKGLPVPNQCIQSMQLSDEHQLRSLKQMTFYIQYHQYRLFDKHVLPTRLTFEHAKLHIKLIFRIWEQVT